MGWPELHAAARRQAGRLHVQQAREHGVGVSTLQRRAKREAWPRPQPGVVELPGAAPGWLGEAWAAVLSAGSRALVGGLAAAHVHGLVDPPRLELVVPADRNPRLRNGVLVHRSTTLTARDAVTLDGLPATSIRRTIRDVAAWHGPEVGVGLLLDAVQQRRTTPRRMERELTRRGPLAGRGHLREACHLARSGIQSAFELRVPPLLAAAGLPPMTAQVPVRAGSRTLHLDFGWTDVRLAVECVGLRPHNSRMALRRDLRRMNSLAAVTGWRVEWVEWTDLLLHRDDLVTRLAALRAQRLTDSA